MHPRKDGAGVRRDTRQEKGWLALFHKRAEGGREGLKNGFERPKSPFSCILMFFYPPE